MVAPTDSDPGLAEASQTGKGTLAIIAGGGNLPSVVAEAALAKGRPVFVIGLRGQADEEVISRYPHGWMDWGQIGRLFSMLEEAACTEIVIIGPVTRPDVKHLKVDSGALKIIPFLKTLGTGGDDRILSSIVRFFEERGYRVIGASSVAPEILADEGLLTKKGPSDHDRADMEVGFAAVDRLGELDIGQAVVVVNRHVMAVEAAEGTDAMLARCADLRAKRYRFRQKKLGVLVKAPKPGQEERIDLPTIGARTVEMAAEAGLAGIAIAANSVHLAEREKAIAKANKLGIFLIGEKRAADG
ncbi:LpxI family protein [Methyloligella solikamskensis]|uniref:LpxI family protein n=1 Tax=Methyloligella solikamskensis TaxID=1177756 RepID=A0ABW3JBU4_9HYPH